MEIRELNPKPQVTSHFVETNLRHSCSPTPESYFTSSLLSLHQGADDETSKSRGCIAFIVHAILDCIDSLLSCLGLKKTRNPDDTGASRTGREGLSHTPSPDSADADADDVVVVGKGGESE